MKKVLTSNTIFRQTGRRPFPNKKMNRLFQISLVLSVFIFFVFPAVAFDPTDPNQVKPGTDDPPSFHSCFYMGNIVDDPQISSTPEIDINQVSFHDGRAIQLFALNQLAGEGHTKSYISEHQGKIADFARENPNISEAGAKPDWYDGRVAALAGLLWCADGVPENESDFFPRFDCNQEGAPAPGLFPEGSVIERMKPYMRPCCVVSSPEEEVTAFPCQLQHN